MKKKLAVIFGGDSCERDVSVITGLQAIDAIDKNRFEARGFFFSRGRFYTADNLKVEDFCAFEPARFKEVLLHCGAFYEIKGSKIKKFFQPEAALMCAHGGDGENGVLSGYLEMMGVPYTCSGVLGSAIGMDKAVSKELFQSMLLNVVKYLVVTRSDIEGNPDATLLHIETFLDYPLIVKPAMQGSSIGIEKARDRSSLLRALEIAASFGEKIVVEKYLEDFKEVNCACFFDGEKIVVSETEEPYSLNEFLTFEDKYISNQKTFGRKIPASISEEEAAVIKSTTERIYSELELFGVVRMDYLVCRKTGKVFINEINTIPGSLAYYLFEPLGITYSDLVEKMVNAAVARRDRQLKEKTTFKSEVLKHYNKSFKLGGNKNRTVAKS